MTTCTLEKRFILNHKDGWHYEIRMGEYEDLIEIAYFEDDKPVGNPMSFYKEDAKLLAKALLEMAE